MDARQEAEHSRLARALDLGPMRRMIDDAAHGRVLTRDDQCQADRYIRLMVALREGRA